MAENDTSDLEKQYERVLQEYRFQIQLNWDRTKHYLTFNTVLFGAAIALYREKPDETAQAGIAMLLFIAAVNSISGQFAVKLGHDYYRRIRATKTALEKELGLERHAILSTPGMRRDHDLALEGTPEAAAGRSAKITTHVIWLLRVISAFAALGALYAGYSAYSRFAAR